MKVPETLQNADRHGAVVRRFEYDDGTLIAVDFGTDEAVTIDIVESTAIVVFDGQHLEFELPAEAEDVSVHNGVVTIEE